MHNDFNDIEQRLRDFQDFEHEITQDVWDNLEGELLVNNAISSFNDFEFDVDDDIWSGIEDRLIVKRPKTAIWWLPGIVVAMLLFTLGVFNLSNIKDSSVESISENRNKKSSNQLVQNSQNDALKTTTDENQNEVESINTDSEKNNVKQPVLANYTTNNIINRIDNNGGSTINNSTVTKKQSIINGENVIKSLPLLAQLNNANVIEADITNPSELNSKKYNSTSGDNNNQTGITDEFEKITTPNAIVAKEDDSFTNDIVDLDNNSNLMSTNIDSVSKDEEILVAENSKVNEILQEEEKEEESKLKRWGLVASAGIGNFKNLQRHYIPQEIVVLNNKSHTPLLKAVDVENEGKLGLKSIIQEKPINLSFATQFNVTERLGLRLGITYTSLKTDFEILDSKNRIKLDYIGVPLAFVHKVADFGKLNINALAIVRTERMINNQYYADFGSGYEKVDRNLDNSESNVALGLGSELEYDISNNFSVLGNIQFMNYTKTDTQNEFNRQKQNVWTEFNLGISQKF